MTTSSRRGYTVVELLMSITVFSLGVSGIIAMQKVVATSNQHAKNLAIANRIAQGWQEMLSADATLWNGPNEYQVVKASDLAETSWLNRVNTSPNQWFRPAFNPAVNYGAGFDALGNVVSDAAITQAQFCTHLRLNWLYPDVAAQANQKDGNGLIRAEVRVFWLRDGAGGGINNQPVCAAGNNPVAIGQAVGQYHFVYHTAAIEQVPPP